MDLPGKTANDFWNHSLKSLQANVHINTQHFIFTGWHTQSLIPLALVMALTYKNFSPPSIGASIFSWPLHAGVQVGCLAFMLSYFPLLPQWQGFFSQLLKPFLQHDLLARHFPYEMWLSHPGVNCSDILLEMWQGRGAHSSSSHCFSGRLSSPEADC